MQDTLAKNGGTAKNFCAIKIRCCGRVPSGQSTTQGKELCDQLEELFY